MNKMLLHICCASCALYVFKKLKKDYLITGFFYNPNIHPRREYEFRKSELKKVFDKYDYPVIYADYDMINWFAELKHLKDEPERGERCSRCFNIRLRKAFKYARENQFNIVATTLSISPYKVSDQINEQGASLSSEFKIEFLDANFKKQNGFVLAKKMAMAEKIQHQNYCGCVYSRVDRIIRVKKRAKK